ncbi:MAG TPA: alpha/beta hydrolase-fold protein [Terriglobia bacterium]|nr:alpha/beta hydrolase-fold protein [Terriglobia bacterium]
MIKLGLLAGCVILLSGSALRAGDAENRQLYSLIKANGPVVAQAEALREHFSSKQLTDGSAVAAYGGDFVWAVQSEQKPLISIDDGQPSEMRSLPNALWVHAARLTTGRSHAHHYRVEGRILGDKRFDTAAYLDDSYPQAGVPQGKLSEQLVCESQVYRGWKISYWIYASPGVDPNTPAPAMVWQDGHRFVFPGNHARLLTVVENLVQQKKVPPMVLVFVAPGYIGDFDNSEYVPNNDVRRMRSILYDTVNDDYNKMVLGEIFPQVEKRYKLRPDGYSRAIGGSLQGGFVPLMPRGGGPRPLDEFCPELGALQRSNGAEDKPTQIVVMDRTTRLMFSMAAISFHFWFARGTGRIFASGWRMVAAILKTAPAVGRCKTFSWPILSR